MFKPYTQHVYYDDTDAGGIVYYANYLKYAERARTDWLHHLGFSHRQLDDHHGIFIVVRDLHATYHAPAKLEDRLEVTTRAQSMGACDLRLIQSVRREALVLCELLTRLVAVNRDGRPTRWPEGLKNRITALLSDS